MTVVQGDLTASSTDVIVNAANEYLRHGGGVAAALAAKGGEEFLADSDRWVSEHGPLRPRAGGGDGRWWTGGEMGRACRRAPL